MRLAVLLSLLLALTPETLLAQGNADSPAGLFNQAEVEYQAGRFRSAIDLLLRAQRLAPDAVLHYNIARAYEGLGELEFALGSYQAYLDAAPQTPDRGAVLGRISSLQALLTERRARATSALVVSPPPVPPEPDAGLQPAPWILLGVGGVGGIVGGVFGGLSLDRSDQATDPTVDGATASDLDAEAGSWATAANVTFTIAGSLAAAGLIWGIIDVAQQPNGDPANARLRFEFGAGHVAMRLDAW